MEVKDVPDCTIDKPDFAGAGTPAVSVCVRVAQEQYAVGIPVDSCVDGHVVELKLDHKCTDAALPNDETVNRYIRTTFNRAEGVYALTTDQIIRGIQAYVPGSGLFSRTRSHTKKTVNRQLYAMEEKGLLERVIVSPPTWKRSGKKVDKETPEKERPEEKMLIFIDAAGYKSKEIGDFIRACDREGIRRPVLVNRCPDGVLDDSATLGPDPSIQTATLFFKATDDPKKHDYKTFFVGYICAYAAANRIEDTIKTPITVLTVFRGLEGSVIPKRVFENLNPFGWKMHFIHAVSLKDALTYIE